MKTLQSALNLWSGSRQFRLVVDGFFGLSTNSKVREYQSANQLAPDGVVGPLTWESLRPLIEHMLGRVPPASNDGEAGEPHRAGVRQGGRSLRFVVVENQDGVVESMDGDAYGAVGSDVSKGEKRVTAGDCGLVTRVAGCFTAPVRS